MIFAGTARKPNRIYAYLFIMSKIKGNFSFLLTLAREEADTSVIFAASMSVDGRSLFNFWGKISGFSLRCEMEEEDTRTNMHDEEFQFEPAGMYR
jgi:hypothetical protein